MEVDNVRPAARKLHRLALPVGRHGNVGLYLCIRFPVIPVTIVVNVPSEVYLTAKLRRFIPHGEVKNCLFIVRGLSTVGEQPKPHNLSFIFPSERRHGTLIIAFSRSKLLWLAQPGTLMYMLLL